MRHNWKPNTNQMEKKTIVKVLAKILGRIEEEGGKM